MLNSLTFFRCFMLVIAVIIPYAEYKAGISAGQFLAAEAFFALCVVLMEVPSGWIGDIWTRKKTIIAGVVFEIIGFAVLGLMQNYWHLLFGQFVIAIGMSLLSGTTNAMLYDTLLEARLTKHYRRLEGLRHSLGLYAVGLSGLVSGWIFAVPEWGPALVIWLTVAFVCIALICAFYLHEPERHKEAVHGNPIKDILISIDTGVRKSPYVGRLMLMVAPVYGVTNAAFWMQQPYYMSLDVAIIWFGVFGACGHLLGGFGAQLSHFLSGRLSSAQIWLVMILWLIVCFAGAALWPGYHGIVLLMSVSALYGTTFPIVQDEINSRVSSARRATLLSCVTLFARLVFCTLGFALSGVLDGEAGKGVHEALLILSGFLCAAALPAWVWFALYMRKTALSKA
jgi:MFS family permease